ncbi:hypothetical protein PC129_g14260 [Phytophthora cactorum]|nr:hypothetical protein Pcac1_g20889 [Phytophthora cactorum]KAG2817252.1 hypothetical protein PC111_g12778 [Phytophthora cactorum]KAG2826175.1 hypothetical protein PC112_g9391 [Phytophthora cactorum]KAG2862379.1 hypothetical protein PC113_g6356 [Phytophthora cactorum]KAG2902362.1 hypothetical protein PC114_g12790 [Phytophthora cactorum]
MEQHAAPSSRSPKRPRTPPNAPSSEQKKPRLSSFPPNRIVCDDTLRIATQLLRDENGQLLADRDALEKSKAALTEELAQTQRSLRDLEDDIARLYRQKQKEMDSQRFEFEQKLQDATARPEESKDIDDATVFFSQQTTTEMDRFVRSCDLWKNRFVALIRELELQTEKVAAQQVQGVVRDIVTSVEIQTLKSEAESKQTRLEWATWLQEETAKCLEERHRQRQDIEVFEAIEKQLTDDRVVELETQLAQKRAVEKEKEIELSLLRAAHEDQVVPKEEFAALETEKKRMAQELEQMKTQIERVEEENATLIQRNKKLVEETQQLRGKQEKSDLDVKQRSLAQDEEIKKLQTQLRASKARETKMAAMLKSAEKEMHKSKQRKEELKILYAKFSSTMDSVSDKAMRLEELGQELKVVQNNTRDLETLKEELEKQVIQLQQDNLSLLQDKKATSEELAKVQTQVRDQESQHKTLSSEMQVTIADLKAQNEALKKQHVKQERQSVGQPSNEGDMRCPDLESTLVTQVAEKEALQMFVQRYYRAAEDKCRGLLEKVSELESQKASVQKQAKESCTVLRMCVQVDSCDESIRATLLEVVATLDGLT